MTRYKKIDYSVIASMVHTVARIKGEPIVLMDTLHDLEHNMQIGCDPRRVANLLGNKIEERYEYTPDGVMKVTTMVVP